MCHTSQCTVTEMPGILNFDVGLKIIDADRVTVPALILVRSLCSFLQEYRFDVSKLEPVVAKV